MELTECNYCSKELHPVCQRCLKARVASMTRVVLAYVNAGKRHNKGMEQFNDYLDSGKKEEYEARCNTLNQGYDELIKAESALFDYVDSVPGLAGACL